MANALERAQFLERLRREPYYIPMVYERCRRDILFWFDWFAITYDPRIDRLTGKPRGVIPFDLYPFQREVILEIQKHIDEGRDLLIEKCRDMGISWILLTVYFWYWLFGKDANFRLGSRNINEVDKPGDMSTMFEKLREELRSQPDFLRPEGFNWGRHATFTRLINPENGCSIIGETANPSFGRSARNTSAALDEHAFWEAGDAAWESCGATTPCRIAVSTPNGSFNRFARMAQRKIADQPDKLTLYWHLNPTHDQAWYEEQKKRYTPSGLAREVEISYALSIEGGVFEMFQQALHVVPMSLTPDLNNPHHLWQPNPELPITVSFDFGRTCCALFMQIDPWYNVDVFHEIILDNSSTENLARAVLATMDKYNDIHPLRQASLVAAQLREQGNNGVVGYTFQYTGDPAGQTNPWQLNQSFSDHDVLRDKGLWPLQVDKVVRARNRLQSGVTLLQSMLSTRFRNRERILIRNADKCPVLIQALQGEYRYKTDNNGDVTNTIHEIHPIEDVVDCLRYGVLQFADIMPETIQRHTDQGRGVIRSNYEFPI